MNNNLNQEYNSGYVQSYEHGHGQMGYMTGYHGMAQWQPYVQAYGQYQYIAGVQNYMGYM